MTQALGDIHLLLYQVAGSGVNSLDGQEPEELGTHQTFVSCPDID